MDKLEQLIKTHSRQKRHQAYTSLHFIVSDDDITQHEHVWQLLLDTLGTGYLYSRTIRSNGLHFEAQMHATGIPFQTRYIPATIWDSPDGIAAYLRYWRSRFVPAPPIHYITHCQDATILAAISCDRIIGSAPRVWHASAFLNQPRPEWMQIVERATELCEEWYLIKPEQVKIDYSELLHAVDALIWTAEGTRITIDTYRDLPFKSMILDANLANIQARMEHIL